MRKNPITGTFICHTGSHVFLTSPTGGITDSQMIPHFHTNPTYINKMWKEKEVKMEYMNDSTWNMTS